MRKMTDSDWIAFAVDFAEAIIKWNRPNWIISTMSILSANRNMDSAATTRRRGVSALTFTSNDYLENGYGKIPEELIKEEIGYEPTDENLESYEDNNSATLCCTGHHIMWDLCEYGEEPYGTADLLLAITYEIAYKYGLLV